MRENFYDIFKVVQDKIKKMFDKKVKVDDFQLGDLVLKWNARFKNKGKHGKFDHLWKRPYKISALSGKNAYFL